MRPLTATSTESRRLERECVFWSRFVCYLHLSSAGWRGLLFIKALRGEIMFMNLLFHLALWRMVGPGPVHSSDSFSSRPALRMYILFRIVMVHTLGTCIETRAIHETFPIPPMPYPTYILSLPSPFLTSHMQHVFELDHARVDQWSPWFRRPKCWL